MDVDFRFEDRDKSRVENLAADFELLFYDLMNALLSAFLMTERIFRSEDILGQRFLKQIIQGRHWLHELYAVFSASSPLSTFSRGTTPFFSQR